MLELGTIDSVIASIGPESVGHFLVKRGYKRAGAKPGLAEVFVEDKSGNLLVVPTNASARDYARRLRDVLEMFANDKTPLDDVVGLVVLPDSDIFRYRIETPETVWGQLRLSYTYEAMHALYDVMRFSAAGVTSKKLEYRGGISESAKLFAEQCRFGQTEYGSFILKVFCPTNPIGIADADTLSEPFGRQTTRAVLENFSFLASEKSEDPSEPLPPTMNRQVASAVSRLQPRTTLGVKTEIGLHFAPIQEPSLLEAPAFQKESSQSFDLGPFVYSRAQSVRDRLTKAEEFGRELLRGHIVELHKDRPLPETEQSHEIKLDVKVGLSRRIVRLRLLPPQYHKAVKWHDANKEIDLDAVIDKRGHIWTVYELFELRPASARPDEPGLFGSPKA
jgi:hypothetical protein